MRLICRRYFERWSPPSGLEVSEAESGERAIELLGEREFDCVLSDYRMGAVTGIDVLAYALKTRPETIRIIMTGFAGAALMKDATERARVHEFLEKPITSDELEKLLRERVILRYLGAVGPARH